MNRPILDEAHIHPAIRDKVAQDHAATLNQVQQALAKHAVVVVGMRMNPYPKKARKLLREAGVAHEYLEFGSYFSEWKPRGALKMWCGWPTLPMVFVRGTLIGGANDLERLIRGGQLTALLNSPAATLP